MMTRGEDISPFCEGRPDAEPASGYRGGYGKVLPRETVSNARRYSLFVKVMKGALPAAAAGLGIAVLSYALQPRDNGRMAMTFEQIGRLEGDLTMVRPRLSGIDDDGHPFVVTAASAVQVGRGSDKVRLEDVIADLSLEDGSTLHVSAADGVVDTKTYVMDVNGVHVTSPEGYAAQTATAHADLKAGIMNGESPIEGAGEAGTLRADRFAIDREARQLRLSGNVHMVLKPAPEAGATAPGSPPVPIPKPELAQKLELRHLADAAEAPVVPAPKPALRGVAE